MKPGTDLIYNPVVWLNSMMGFFFSVLLYLWEIRKKTDYENDNIQQQHRSSRCSVEVNVCRKAAGVTVFKMIRPFRTEAFIVDSSTWSYFEG